MEGGDEDEAEGGGVREGRHEPLQCRNESPRFVRQTEPLSFSKSLRHIVNKPLLYRIVSLKLFVFICSKEFFVFFST